MDSKPSDISPDGKPIKSNNSKKSISFEKLMNIYENANHNKKIKFDEEVKRYAMCIFVTGGRSNYLRHMNSLPLPKPSTLYKFYAGQSEYVLEGVLKTSEFANYIKIRRSSQYVWTTEDTTAVTSRIEYDRLSKRIIGNILQVDVSTGMPIIPPLKMLSARDVKQQAESIKKETNLNVVMGFSLSIHAAPFCLLAYGISKSLSGETYATRVQFIKDQLAQHGIICVGCSTDDASPYVRGMKILSGLNNKPDDYTPTEYSLCLVCSSDEPLYCVQDTIHLGGKLKNRFLAMGKIHRIGNLFILIKIHAHIDLEIP
ncbi:uncharacterized protein LOC129716866 [Wyeomyia smithii]|uniref:uncharacterized protein LOC129716866 n=1 Tax=Wyeomyia smithii TaxID=174621 RepID=UPI002467C415|nr:uncharacterized protein LOC129716866 [Wyeomyia smithii]